MPSFTQMFTNLAASDWSFAFQAQFNRWLLVLFFLGTGALVVYLYRAQQRVASRRIILALTALRVALILLIFLVLLGPTVQWRHTGESGGTLWFVVDQSKSMAHVDAQADDVEKLRWADTLGLIPAEFRASKLDRRIAELNALRDDLAYHKTRSELASEEKDARKRVEAFAGDLQKWNGALGATIEAVEKDPAFKPAAPQPGAANAPAPAEHPILASLKKVRNGMDAGVKALAKREKVEEAAGDIPWQAAEQNLEAAAAGLEPMARKADEQLLAEKGADAKLREAMAEVAKKTRADLALAALTDKAKLSKLGLIDVMPKQNTKVVGFADQPQPVPSRDPAELPNLLKTAVTPTGASTNLASTLQWVQEQIGQDEPATVVVVSDGRQNIGGDLIEPARMLASRNVRVFTLAVGSEKVVPDATVEQVDLPDWVYKDDTIKATALLRLDGLKDKDVSVEFWRGKDKIGSKTVRSTQERASQRVQFEDKPPSAGLHEYEVRVVELADETIKDNNRQAVRVSVKEDKLHILVVDDQPRWEYRYLTNYLERDNRVKLQRVLLQPALIRDVQRPTAVRASPENKSVEADLLPNTKEGWAAFDVIVLGDLPPDELTRRNEKGQEVQEMIAAAVKDRGSTLIVVAGQHFMPGRYAARPGGAAGAAAGAADPRTLADLLPVYLNSAWSPAEKAGHLKNGYYVRRAPEGKRHVLSDFTVDRELNEQLWSALKDDKDLPWYWHADQTEAKRGASVVWMMGERSGDAPGGAPATTGPTTAPAGDPSLEEARRRALLATMRFGAGQVMYLASDSSWRLRQVGGNNLHERLWGQVIRWATGSDLPAGGKLVRFGTDKPRYVGGEPVLFKARVLGEDLAPKQLEKDPQTGQTKAKVVARSLSGAKDAAGRGKIVGESALVESPESPGTYTASLSNLEPGPVELTLQGAEVEKLLAKDATATQKAITVDVQAQANLEQRNINTDHESMRRIARAGGGIALDGAYGDVMAAHVPELNYKTENTVQVGLFTDPKDYYTKATHWGFLILFVSLITAEWIIRKVGGLV